MTTIFKEGISRRVLFIRTVFHAYIMGNLGLLVHSFRWALPKKGAVHLLPTGSEEREVFGVGSIPVAILPSCQDMKSIAL